MLDYPQILQNCRKTEKYSANVVRLITQKFFALDEDSRSEFFAFFRSTYGNSAYQKLIADFPNWQTSQTIPEGFYEGVHSFVIRFLKNNDLFVVLENEFKVLVENFRIRIADKTIQIKDLAQVYLSFFNELNVLNGGKLNWLFYHSKDFKAIENVFDHFKYIQMLCLDQSFQQVYRDMQLILGRLQAEFRLNVPDNCEVKYLIEFLGVEIEIPIMFKLAYANNRVPFFEIEDLTIPENNSLFKDYISQYLADKRIQFDYQADQAEMYKSLTYNDLNTFFERYNYYKDNSNQIQLNSTLRAEGGWFNFDFKINYSIEKSSKINHYKKNNSLSYKMSSTAISVLLFVFVTATSINPILGIVLTFVLALSFTSKGK